MISIKNRQRSVPVDVAQMRLDLEFMLKKAGYSDYDISVVITNDRAMRVYNRDYRGMDRSTDVLSFPFYTDILPGQRIKANDPEEQILGDIILSAPYIVRAAANLNISFEERLRLLLVHGFYHLLGYDHVTDEDYQVMHAAEMKMLRALQKSSR